MIKEVVIQLAESGILIVILAFLFLFTILYAILVKVRVFDEKNINLIIALTISLLVILLDFKTGSFGFIKFISYVFPYVSLIIVGLLAWALLVGVFKVSIDWKLFIAAIILIELIIPDTFLMILFLHKTGKNVPAWLGFLESSGFKAALIGVVVFFVLIWFITKKEKAS